TSRTRQLGTSMRDRARNSWADAKVSGCQPAQRISESNDSRTDISSSTTNTTGAPREPANRLDSLPGPSAELMSTSVPDNTGVGHLIPSAALTESSRAVSPNGLNRHSTAP